MCIRDRTYTFIFGAMFGDVGQGLCLFIGGGLIYLIKKINLAGIISVAGLFSTFFGFMFGSIFGFEDIIDAVWLLSLIHISTMTKSQQDLIKKPPGAPTPERKMNSTKKNLQNVH